MNTVISQQIGKYTVLIYSSGHKFWHLNGELHREDGPAIEYKEYSYWFLNNKNYPNIKSVEELIIASIIK